MALLEAEGLSRSFSRAGGAVPALAEASFTLGEGETLGLVGPSGSGKTTLARIIMRLVEPQGGRLAFEGEDLLALRGARLRAVRARLQMVFQDPLAAFNPRASVGGVLEDPLRIHAIVPARQRRDRVIELLERVGLGPELAGRGVHEISGGQRQRVAIARAIATAPRLIVLDEAVSALDVSIRGQVLKLLVELQRETGVSYIFVSHDLAVVRAIAHRVAVMDRGRIVETGPVETVISSPQAETTKALIAAVPRLA